MPSFLATFKKIGSLNLFNNFCHGLISLVILKGYCIPGQAFHRLLISEAATKNVPQRSCSQKFRNIHMKTPVLGSQVFFWCFSVNIAKFLITLKFLK